MTWAHLAGLCGAACAAFLAAGALMLGGSLLVTWIADRLTGGDRE
jgi:hypothetical protein